VPLLQTPVSIWSGLLELQVSQCRVGSPQVKTLDVQVHTAPLQSPEPQLELPPAGSSHVPLQHSWLPVWHPVGDVLSLVPSATHVAPGLMAHV